MPTKETIVLVETVKVTATEEEAICVNSTSALQGDAQFGAEGCTSDSVVLGIEVCPATNFSLHLTQVAFRSHIINVEPEPADLETAILETQEPVTQEPKTPAVSVWSFRTLRVTGNVQRMIGETPIYAFRQDHE
jgi:hypothetical protein